MTTQCARCGTDFPSFTSGESYRCKRCGCVSHLDGTPISPVMTPAYQCNAEGWRWRGEYVARLSPWMLSHTRPVVGGWYDVRFDTLVTPLWWDNYIEQFTAGYLGPRVDCRRLQTWRGGWAL